MKTIDRPSWTINSARKLYNIRRWGQGFFDINDAGKLVALNPRQQDQPGIELSEVVSSLQTKGLDFPILLRFIDVLHFRIQQLHSCFQDSMKKYDYQGHFYPVYPIKVNQQFSVVEAIINTPELSVGLEAGSKTELLAVLSLMVHSSGVIVCNGYKDREYVRLALISERLGYQTFIVLEKLSELKLVLSQAEELDVKPRLGIRLQLNSTGHGVWQNTGGDKSKFGLSASEVLSVIETLKQHKNTSYLQLLHFHLGSQIPDIKYIQRATVESAQYLNQLHQLGCQIRYIDVGGGLGIDYDGSSSSNDFSINYNTADYAECMVASFSAICNKHAIPHPDILTESGRAMTAHHAVLITNVIETESTDLENTQDHTMRSAHLSRPELVRLNQLCNDSVQAPLPEVNDIYQQANRLLKQIHELFKQGECTIEQRAFSEQKYRNILRNIQQQSHNSSSQKQPLIDDINQKLAAKYFCNFSLFQSLPDIWALRQIFPIMPLQHLQLCPQQPAVLRDITCDSDGRIDHYIANEEIQQSIRLHSVNEHETYLLGFFLVGAYQEILGDMHNLFGDTHSVNIRFEGKGYSIDHQQQGDSVEYILNHVHFDSTIILKNFEDKIKSAMLKPSHAEKFLAELKSCLRGYSYLKSTST